MKDLRRRFERFCLKNRGKGIPNLMLVIAIGNLAVFALSYIDPSNIVYSYLCFSRSAILRGQVWRLFSYIFTYLNDVRGAGLLLAAVSLFCYYQFGKILESYWGTFRFNLYYLTGLVLTDLAALLLGAGADASALGMKTGDALVAVSSLDSPSFASCIGVLDQLSVIYPNNPGQNVLQFYSETSYGSSGGAVYTQNGIWVGSISGGDTYGTCWAVPYGTILTEFQKCLIELAAQDAGQ